MFGKMLRSLTFISFLFVLNLPAQNIFISAVSSPNEPCIKMDPNQPNVLLAATNINNLYVSLDTGHTWTHQYLSSTYGVWGDPVIDVDTAGHFYFFHLSNPSDGNWIDRIVCQKSTDNGSTWSNGSFMGLNGTKAQDKEWSIIDRNNNNIYVTWTQFDDYGSTSSADSSLILFSKSTDAGETWSEAKRINKVAGNCIDSDDTVEGAVPALGPNGEIYVAWAGPSGLVFNRSTDQGETWLEEEIFIDAFPGGWDYSVPGIYRCNGLPVTKCDLSGGPDHGTIYVNWTDQRNGTDDTDVWLVRSTDGGNTWSDPIRVNDDEPGSHQFFSWMDIDQTNGNLFFVFYDRRNYSDNLTDVYIAYSLDGGETFTNKQISEFPFMPNPGVFFGDYTNIQAHNNIVRPIWTRLANGTLTVWTDVTPFDVTTEIAEPSVDGQIDELNQFPNPATGLFYISFKLHKSSLVNLKLYNANGREVEAILEQKQLGLGKHIIPINPQELHLESGIYYPRLFVNGTVKTLKTIVVE